ncbi:MAG: IS1634 family transposase [Cyclobacteriaceae bacterium]
MYIDIVPNRNSAPAILLRESYRDENGKVKKRTLANLSAMRLEEAYKMRAVLKGAAVADQPLAEAFEVIESKAHGNVAAVLGVMERLKFPSLLARSDSEERRNALALIAGRILAPSSKLALSRELTGSASTLAEELKLDADLDENDLYLSMKWLWQRQEKVQQRLAKSNLSEGSVILYDLSSSYYEGQHCEIAKRGHNRDGKKGKTQINYGVLTNSEGCPVAVEVYPGNVSDPSTVADQLRKLRKQFGLKSVTIVGDRGMLTSKQLELAQEDETLKDFSWVSALRSDQIKKLLNSGTIQPELFDQRSLLEITSDEFPGERLVVCRNPELAQRRSHTREDLLNATQTVLEQLVSAVNRSKNPYHGKDKIAARIQREAAKYKVLKHFEIEIGEQSLSYQRNEEAIASEAKLDGFYVVRARNIAQETMNEDALVATYKSLSGVQRVSRNMKTSLLHVRPIFHRKSDMVRAHIFICMLAAHVQWQMEQSLKELLFADEELAVQKQKRTSAVHKTDRSESAKRKGATKRTTSNLPAHSFKTLLKDLGSLCKNICQPNISGAPTFTKITQPSSLQRRVFELLKLTPPRVCSQKSTS